MIYLHSFQYKNDRKYEYNTLKKKLKHLTDVHVYTNSFSFFSIGDK